MRVRQECLLEADELKTLNAGRRLQIEILTGIVLVLGIADNAGLAAVEHSTNGAGPPSATTDPLIPPPRKVRNWNPDGYKCKRCRKSFQFPGQLATHMRYGPHPRAASNKKKEE